MRRPLDLNQHQLVEGLRLCVLQPQQQGHQGNGQLKWVDAVLRGTHADEAGAQPTQAHTYQKPQHSQGNKPCLHNHSASTTRMNSSSAISSAHLVVCGSRVLLHGADMHRCVTLSCLSCRHFSVGCSTASAHCQPNCTSCRSAGSCIRTDAHNSRAVPAPAVAGGS